MKWRKLYRNKRNRVPFPRFPVMSKLTLKECLTSAVRNAEVGRISKFTFLVDYSPSPEMAMRVMDKRQFRTWRRRQAKK